MVELPLVTALQQLACRLDYPFYAPGHKRGQGIDPILAHHWGREVFGSDLPELPELDNLFAPTGPVAAAQSLAAQLWGADRSWFLVNGSTVGIMAAILAICGDGDELLLPRNAHQAAIAGVILAGATPVFLEPVWEPQWDLAFGFTESTLVRALQDHPQAKGVLALHPTYHGVGSDLGTLADLTHAWGLPLLVDEAHGAHFGFHPDLPPSALSLGADVVVQSTHKVLGALSQASVLHLQGERVEAQRLDQALQLLQSTSPNALLLASLDAARGQMADGGEALMTQVLNLSQQARKALAAIPDLKLLDASASGAGFTYLDPTRLTVDIAAWGITGFEVDEILRHNWQVTAELPSLRQLTFIISLGNKQEDIDTLIKAFQQFQRPLDPHPLHVPVLKPPPTELCLSPRWAVLARHQTLPAAQAPGHINTRLLCPYPPGIPVLIPGERITAEAIAYLETIAALGGVITGLGPGGLAEWDIIKTDSV